MGETPLARVRRLCLALPETCEKTAWGAPTFRVGSGRAQRMFATYADDHHGDGRVALWCAAPPGAQEVFARSEPARYFRPAYVGKSGWLGVVLERVDDATLAGHLREAYRTVAPAPLAAALDAGGAPRAGGARRAKPRAVRRTPRARG